MQLAFDFTQFVGRFHPLFVHLPIGFILLALLMELYQKRIKKTADPSKLISFSWLLAALSGTAAAFCGWYLGSTGLYFEQTLKVHRWLGITLVIATYVGWWIKRNPANVKPIIHNSLNALVFFILVIEGHLGGNLTHGETYLLEHAPAGIQKIMGVESVEKLDLSKRDSVLAYAELIHPIFERKCVNCHGNTVKRGGLNMASFDSLMIGGNGGPPAVAGSPESSELFRRITLPQGNTKFMPPTGDPLTYDEIKLVEWWIANGADADQSVLAMTSDESMKAVLMRNFNLDTKPKPWYEKVVLDPLDSTSMVMLADRNFKVNTLGGENPLLDLSYDRDTLSSRAFEGLEKVYPYITWLTLSGIEIEPGVMQEIGKFENLTKLKLENTNVTNEGLIAFSNLRHLESLNIYGTDISDASIETLKKLNKLERLYIWQTDISEAGVEELTAANPSLEVVAGLN